MMSSSNSGDIQNDRKNDDILFLFDIDETLTKPRQFIEDEMDKCLQKLKERVTVGLVGGSDLKKIAQQTMPSNLRDTKADPIDVCVNRFDYVFAENGLVAYKDGQLIGRQNIIEHLGEERYQRFLNFCWAYMSTLVLPAKRDLSIETRNGLINVCPVGRNCSQEMRDQFAAYDEKHKIREKFIQELDNKFGQHSDDPLDLEFVIGGQISFDVYPKGWDKTYCLNFLGENFKDIHFFGDKTHPGGNDHAIFIHDRTIGHTVQNPTHTLDLLKNDPKLNIYFKST